jgi:hypothetical protein
MYKGVGAYSYVGEAYGIACGNIRVRPYDTIEVITFLCVSPVYFSGNTPIENLDKSGYYWS